MPGGEAPDVFSGVEDRVPDALADRLRTIALVASLIQQAERWLPQLVHDARANDHGWTAIAQALGTNPTEARLRFDPESPIADGRWSYEHLRRTRLRRGRKSEELGRQRQ